MITHIIKTNEIYKQIMNSDTKLRDQVFDEKILTVFDPMFQMLQMSKEPALMGCLTLSGADDILATSLNELEKASSWERMENAISDTLIKFSETGLEVPDVINAALLIGDSNFLAQSKGITGMGSIPGYMMVIVAPNDYNVNKIASCTAHECHHNILFNNIQWSFMNVTVSQYLAIEGLAEAFAESCYGSDHIGPWVTMISADELNTANDLIQDNLDIVGFMAARTYVFGDHPMLSESERIGMPYCGGYAAGFHAVKAYLKRYKKSVVEATIDFVKGIDIVKESGYY